MSVSEEEMRERIMNGEVPDDGAAEDMPGKSDEEMNAREREIMERILDGDITNVDTVDTGESVNKAFLIQQLRRKSEANESDEVDAEEEEMRRKILNGEI